MFKIIPNTGGRYEISNNGNIYDNELFQLTPQGTNKFGYKMASIRTNGKQKLCSVHRLVALAFVLNVDNKPQVNHIDGDKKNNKSINLEWVTNKENCIHARDNGLSTKESLMIQVSQYTKDGVFIRTFRSFAEATHITGIDASSIVAVTNGRRKSAGGFIWVKYK